MSWYFSHIEPEFKFIQAFKKRYSLLHIIIKSIFISQLFGELDMFVCVRLNGEIWDIISDAEAEEAPPFQFAQNKIRATFEFAQNIRKLNIRY